MGFFGGARGVRRPQQWERGVLTTGPPGKSPEAAVLNDAETPGRLPPGALAPPEGDSTPPSLPYLVNPVRQREGSCHCWGSPAPRRLPRPASGPRSREAHEEPRYLLPRHPGAPEGPAREVGTRLGGSVCGVPPVLGSAGRGGSCSRALTRPRPVRVGGGGGARRDPAPNVTAEGWSRPDGSVVLLERPEQSSGRSGTAGERQVGLSSSGPTARSAGQRGLCSGRETQVAYVSREGGAVDTRGAQLVGDLWMQARALEARSGQGGASAS